MGAGRLRKRRRSFNCRQWTQAVIENRSAVLDRALALLETNCLGAAGEQTW
jgi:hypothetical protein